MRADIVFHCTEGAEKHGSAFVEPCVLCMGRADISVFDAGFDHFGVSVWARDRAMPTDQPQERKTPDRLLGVRHVILFALF